MEYLEWKLEFLSLFVPMQGGFLQVAHCIGRDHAILRYPVNRFDIDDHCPCPDISNCSIIPLNV